MCGICGMLNTNGKPADLTLLKDMMGLMRHRGPDDEGIYKYKNMGMGIRRLSVIDLSTGHQPISNEDESIWVMQNGEIYNYQEVRYETESKGHVYKTKSDTEVIVHLYEEYGEEFVDKLNGMFSIALWDERQEKLILVRDRFGIKPLFYFFDGHKLLFSSEIKAILSDPTINREINPTALNQYLTYKFVPAPLTMLKDITKLLPAHMLIYAQGKIKIRPYWNLKYDKLERRSKDYYLNHLHNVLRESVRRHLISDVPIGIFLSGGIDSSIIVSIVNELVDGPVETFSITFGGERCDESRYARMVAERFKTRHHEFAVKPDAIQILPKLIWHMDEPLGDSCLLPTYYLSKFSREYVTVALSGDGGDELFAGYQRYRREKFISLYGRIPRWIREGVLGPASKLLQVKSKVELFNEASTLSLGKRYKLWTEIIPEDVRYGLVKNNEFSDIGLSDIILNYFEECDVPENLNKMLYVDLKTYLPDDLLLKVDRMSMAHSLEVRVPFLDREVVEFASMLPINLKLRNFSNTKYLLREYLKKYLPTDIYKREKQGFNLPIDSWFRGELKAFACQVLLDPGVGNRAIFDSQGLKFLLDEHGKGKNYGEAIWALIVFELWRKQYVKG